MSDQHLPNKNVSVNLVFRRGTLDSGFSVTARLFENGKQIDQKDSIRISGAPELQSRYEAWRVNYLDQGRSLSKASRAMDIPPAVVGYPAVGECRKSARDLSRYLDETWFESNAFQSLKDWISGRTLIHTDKSVPIFFEFNTDDRAQDTFLRRLPWSRWDLFKELSNTEPAIGIAFGKPVDHHLEKIKVLLVLGSDEGGINLEDDSKFVSELSEIGAQIKRLSCPDGRDLYVELRDNSYDILFFAGHSLSEGDQQDGSLLLKPGVSVSIEALGPAFKAAVQNGLKLAIFNSCDGLGLADPLIKRAKISSVIAFREPVPDEIARTFLKYFLEEFASGKPLFRSVREARNQLRFLENRPETPLPGASWLPVVCQNPSQSEIVLDISSSLAKRERRSRQPVASLRLPENLRLWWIAGSIATLASVGSLFMGPQLFQSNNASGVNNFISEGERTFLISEGEKTFLISEGEKTFLDISDQSKVSGNKAYSEEEWDNAVKLFLGSIRYEVDLEREINPETWIYFNNAVARKRAKENGVNIINIATAIPLDKEDAAKEILRGVALRQSEFNCKIDELRSLREGEDVSNISEKCPGKDGNFVVVTIANESTAGSDLSVVDIARALSNKLVIAVVGHFSTDTCGTAGAVYKSAKIVMVSPTCTGNTLKAGKDNYFFRTITRDSVAAQELAEIVVDGKPIKDRKSAIVYVKEGSEYSQSFAREFKEASDKPSDDTVCPSLADDSFSAEACAKSINTKKPEVLLLSATSKYRDQALSILEYLDENILVVGNDSLFGKEAIGKYGKFAARSGLRIYVSWHPALDSPTPFEKNANQLFNINFGLNWRTQSSYDAASAIIEGIQRNGFNVSGEILSQTLDTKASAGVLGKETVSFDDGERNIKELGDSFGVVVQVAQYSSSGEEKFRFVRADSGDALAKDN